MKTKKVMICGKQHEISFEENDIEAIEREVDHNKLNGYDEKSFLRFLDWKYQTYWKEEALEIFRNRKAPEIKVGLECTIILYTDRLAATVSKVYTQRKVAVKCNMTKCIDFYNSNYVVLDELDDDEEQIFTLRKGGCWVAQGQPKKSGSVILGMGYRHHYIDPSF